MQLICIQVGLNQTWVRADSTIADSTTVAKSRIAALSYLSYSHVTFGNTRVKIMTRVMSYHYSKSGNQCHFPFTNTLPVPSVPVPSVNYVHHSISENQKDQMSAPSEGVDLWHA
ncbi:hypothetical protein AAC387_Pa01g1000 [Persea americana]